MICSECGQEGPAHKTVYWIADGDEAEEYVLCEPCYGEVADEVWIVPGPCVVFGKCRLCGEWESLRDLSDRRGGGRWDSPTGLCPGCAGP